MKLPLLLLALLPVLVCACAGGQEVTHDALREALPAPAFPPPAVVGWEEGRPSREDGRLWVAGDALLFGLRFDTASDSRQWLVRLTSLPPSGERTFETVTVTVRGEPRWYRTEQARIRVEVFDAQGRLQSDSIAAAGRWYFQTGTFATCAVSVAVSEGEKVEEGGEAENSSALGVVSLLALFRLVERNEALAPILRAVVGPPSLLSLLRSLGVHLSVRVDLNAVEPGQWGPAGEPAYSFPLTMDLNDRPALLCRVVVVEPRAPLHLAAGVVAIDAVHPRDASRRFSMCLLAARCAD